MKSRVEPGQETRDNVVSAGLSLDLQVSSGKSVGHGSKSQGTVWQGAVLRAAGRLPFRGHHSLLPEEHALASKGHLGWALLAFTTPSSP